MEIQAELDNFENKLKEHEKDRRRAKLRHDDSPGLIASIKLSAETAITEEDILDAHLFHEDHTTKPRFAGVPPKGATHKGVFNWIRNVLAFEKHSDTFER